METGLHAAVSGKDGSPLVLLHGFGGSAETWTDLIPLLDGRRAIAFDLPGHGRSVTWPGAGPAKVAVKAVLASLDAMGIKTFHVCGHSFGGAVATLVALAEPQRVLSATLLAPGGFGPQINARLLRRFARSRAGTDLLPVLETMFGWANPVPDRYLEQVEASRKMDGVADQLERIAGSLFARDEQGVIPRDSLATLPMPVTVLWGEQDCVLPATQARNLPPRFAVHLFETAGHMLVEEVPGDIAVLLQRTMAAGDVPKSGGA